METRNDSCMHRGISCLKEQLHALVLIHVVNQCLGYTTTESRRKALYDYILAKKICKIENCNLMWIKSYSYTAFLSWKQWH